MIPRYTRTEAEDAYLEAAQAAADALDNLHEAESVYSLAAEEYEAASDAYKAERKAAR